MEPIIGGKSSRVVEVDIKHRLLTSAYISTSAEIEISLGRVGGISHINKFGVGTVAGAAHETVWDGAGVSGITDYTYMTTPSILYISSDADGDTQKYEIQGLDGYYTMQRRTVTASGKTFIAIPGTWLRVFRVKNIGTTNNAGNIYVSDDNTDVGGNGIPDTVTNIKAMIIIGNNQTLMSMYTVPAGLTALMTHWVASCGKGDDLELVLKVRPVGGVFQRKDQHDIYETDFVRPFNPYLNVPEKHDIAITSKIGAAGGQTSAGFDLYLVDNKI